MTSPRKKILGFVHLYPGFLPIEYVQKDILERFTDDCSVKGVMFHNPVVEIQPSLIEDTIQVTVKAWELE